jgi:integrase
VPIYNRNEDYPDREPNWWLDYYAHGERIREPGCGANDRASKRLLEQREREVKIGTWRHPRERASDAVTVEQHFEKYFAARAASAELATSHRAQQNVADQRKRVAAYVLPRIGSRSMVSITTKDIKTIVAELVREKRLAPRTIHHVYNDVRGMFLAASTGDDPIIPRNPCTLSSKGYDGGLPKKRDKNPAWRSKATFTHGELRQAFTDERIPIDRRTLYALIFFCGNRFGEAAGRRISDYDAEAQPLGRIVCATQYDDQALKGDAPARDIPVHPFLAWMLEQWLTEGFQIVMQREPKPDDWLVPSRRGELRASSHTRNRLMQDLERIGLRPRSPHVLRAAFISLAQQDGGERSVLECVTHKGNQDVWGGYTRHPWPVLCEHVARLRMEPPPREAPSHLQSHAEKRSPKLPKPLGKVGRGDWIRRRHSIMPASRTLGFFESTVLDAYMKFNGLLNDGVAPVTSRVTAELADDLRAAAEAIQTGRPLPGELRARLAGAVQAVAGALDELAVTLEPAELGKGRSA